MAFNTPARRGARTGALVIVASMILAVASTVVAQDQPGKRPVAWVCPPCGEDCHLVAYDEPGTCPNPECGMKLVPLHPPRTVAIVLWNGVELLDFAGPTEVFSKVLGPRGPMFRVLTVAATSDPIVSMLSVKVMPQFTIDNCPKPDIIVIPGGSIGAPLTDPRMIDWLRDNADDAEVAMSVCTGAFVLAAAGQLEGQQATTFYGAIADFRVAAPATTVHDDQRWVDNGHTLTTAGVSAGIDGALHIVARLCGRDIARRTAKNMEYNWRPDEFPGLVTSPGDRREYTLSQKIITRLLNDGVDAAWAEYSAALGTPDEPDLPTMNGVNWAGYRYLSNRDYETAIAVFTFNVKAHPDSFFTWDGLAEAYMDAGDNDKAIEYYRKSLELNSRNINAVNMLKKLGVDP